MCFCRNLLKQKKLGKKAFIFYNTYTVLLPCTSSQLSAGPDRALRMKAPRLIPSRAACLTLFAQSVVLPTDAELHLGPDRNSVDVLTTYNCTVTFLSQLTSIYLPLMWGNNNSQQTGGRARANTLSTAPSFKHTRSACFPTLGLRQPTCSHNFFC